MHTSECTGCPHCNAEMAAILQDSIAGRYRSLAGRLSAITQRTLRALGAGAKHPGYRALNPREVPSPSWDECARGTNRRRTTSDAQRSDRERLTAFLKAGQPHSL